jgi:progressive ankylosis protein
MARTDGAGSEEAAGGGAGSSGTAAAAASAVGSYTGIFLFWVPLAAQWVMMAVEGPFLAAIIARMGDPAFNLAAYGVAFALAILIESPVIMLMSASTALVEDAASYRRLRNFANLLNAASTAVLLLLLVPAVYDATVGGVLGLPEDVTRLVYGSLWLLLPWPAAIGYRRFLHGVMIRSGRTRLVAYGTLLRLGGMAATAFALYLWGGIPGAWVGAAALSAGVCVEALATRIMAAPALRELLGDGAAAPEPLREAAGAGAASVAHPGAGAGEVATAETALRRRPRSRWRARGTGYGEIARFYFPLALTSIIGLTVHPMLTFFMGRAPAPVESLAVFPVVHGLSFLFRAPGFSYQEAVIALVGRRFEHVRRLAVFGAAMALVTSGGLALVAFTPLAGFWFETVSGLPPELAELARVPTMILVPLPAVAVLLAFQQALLVQGRDTRWITGASAVEVASIGILFVLFGWRVGLIGVSAAMLALVGGRLMGGAFMVRPVRRVLRARRGGPAAAATG